MCSFFLEVFIDWMIWIVLDFCRLKLSYWCGTCTAAVSSHLYACFQNIFCSKYLQCFQSLDFSVSIFSAVTGKNKDKVRPEYFVHVKHFIFYITHNLKILFFVDNYMAANVKIKVHIFQWVLYS